MTVPYAPPPGASPASPGWPRPGPPGPPHQSPQPYHRVLRTGDYRWWKPLLGLAVFAIAFAGLAGAAFAAGFLVELVRTGGDADLASDAFTTEVSPTVLLFTNLFLAAGIPAAMLAALVAHRLRPGWLGSVRPGLRWGLLARFLALAGVLGVGYLALAAFLPVGGPGDADGIALAGLGQWASFAVVVVLTTPLQAAGEEYALRGYLLQVCGAWVRTPWFGVAVTGLLFALAHGLQGPALFADRLAFGLVAGWLVVRTGGLEAAIAAHVANNMVLLLVSAAFDTVGDTLTVTDIAWPFAALSIGQVTLFAVLADRMARHRQVVTRTPTVAGAR